MPGLSIRRVCVTVREFMDEFKKAQYAFDIISADLIDGEWEVECEVTNFSDSSPVGYLVRVEDATGVIIHVSRQEPSDGDDEDDDDEEVDDDEDDEPDDGDERRPAAPVGIPGAGGRGFGGY